jgi:tetratricopeptide (TPR) repeat protein/TolB-like protein/DNA-binding winged helix-turn-helix (wHTH) protein
VLCCEQPGNVGRSLNSDLLQGFYLDSLLIEPLKGQVTGRAGSRHLPPKAVEVLLCLARAPGDLVTREDLLNAVWGSGRGSQEALGHAVSEIRHALDDHADDPHYVQTLPKRGYRLAVHPVLANESTSTIVLGADNGAQFSGIGLIENLKRRGVLETALAYLIVGWLLIQIADIVFSQLHLPDWAATFVTVFVIAGFPIAIVLSWFLEYRDGRTVVDDLSPVATRRRRFGRTYLSVIGALAAASALVFVYDLNVGLPTSAPEPIEGPAIAESSIAVLPFLNIDGSGDTQIFANGLVDDVITRLSRVPGLLVSSRGDSFSLAPNSASAQVRQRLRVAMYLEGSVQMDDDRIRVIVQLIDSGSGFHVLSRSFDRPLEDFFDIRDEVTGLTVANIRVALPPGTQSSLLQDPDQPTLDAYVLYRRGIDASRMPASMDTISTALGWFDAALEADPDYAAAHAGKCAVFAHGYPEVDDPAFVEKAESSCATALELNPNLDVVHTALGQLYSFTGRYGQAVEEFRKALAIDPSSALSLIGLGDVYSSQNRPEEAEAALRQAIGLHPGDSNAYNRLGFFLYRFGRYGEAVEQYQQVIALNPEDMNGYSNLGTAYMLMGNFAAAAPAFQKAIEIAPKKVSYSNLGLMYYYLGNLEEAVDTLFVAVELEPNDHLARSNLGDALWVAGRTDEAISSFQRASALAQSALRVNPNDPYTMMDIAWIDAMLGKHDAARSLMDKSLALAPDEPYAHYYNALVLLRAGDPGAAVVALAKAVEMGYSKAMMAAEPHLAELENNPEFLALVD